MTGQEERLYLGANKKLLEAKLIIERAYLNVLNLIDNDSSLNQEQKNEYYDQALEAYQKELKPFEKKYDQKVNKILSWKKIRRR